MFDIKNKVAVVTGGTGTLGGSISKYLAKNGVKKIMLFHFAPTTVLKLQTTKI